MDKETVELIALGASAAVNCRPCMEHHLAAGRTLGIAEEDLHGALNVGLRVNRGAHVKTAEYIRDGLGLNMREEKDECCD